MWNPSSLGVAQWRQGAWTLSTTIDAESLRMSVSCQGSAAAYGEISFLGKPLPQVLEMYIRGDELHLVLPQPENSQSHETIAGLEVVLLPILTDHDALVVESTVSLQTQWLDVEPTVLMQLSSQGPLAQHALASALSFTSPAPASTSGSLRSSHSAQPASPWTSLLVDSRDQTSLVPTTSPGPEIGFFGDFMEKGVIRKVQPWWIWTTSPINQRAIQGLADQLSQRPLPLAS